MKRSWPIILIIVAYLFVGTLYAVYTPRWQVPDEPAHYNYIRALAEERSFPVMERQDYDQDYIGRLTSRGFPSELSIDPLTYEDHQPPLYYLLATPVYWLFDGDLLPLRLFSLVLGGFIVLLTALITLEVFPKHASLAWLAAGLVAFLPQHVAMMAGVNNDSLTEALLALWLMLALRYLRCAVRPLPLGVVLGLLLVTKTTGYVALPLALLVVGLRWQRGGLALRRALEHALLVLVPAILLGGLWWGRNVGVYGWPDLLGLMAHNAAVVGQPLTADFVARDGLLPFLVSAVRTTFRSFWGQFGWMGVVLDSRIYLGALIFSVLALWGAGWQLVEALRKDLKPRHHDALILLGSSTLLTVLLAVGYNVTFVQHQGRYLFPALPTLALATAVGLRRLTEKRLAVVTALILVVVVLVLGVMGLLRGDLSLWAMALTGGAALILLVSGLLPRRWNPWLGGGLIAGLVALDLWCLFGFIVPILTQ